MSKATRNWNPLFLPALVVTALGLMFCEPGNSLNPTTPTPDNSGKTPRITVVDKPDQLLPGDTGLVRIQVVDSADAAQPLRGAKLAVTSANFVLVSANSTAPFKLDTVPDDGFVSFRILSPATGTSSISVRITSGSRTRTASFTVQVTEKPVQPRIVEDFPNQLVPGDTTAVVFTVADSTGRALSGAVVTLTSDIFEIIHPTSADTFSMDTTSSDGRVRLRLRASTPQPENGNLSIRVRSAAGVVYTGTYNFSVRQESSVERPRQMVFTALRSTLRADGSDSTELRVLIKDDNNNPMKGEKITFTSTGGLVKAEAVTDEWGRASSLLISERVNKSVIVTATLVRTGATAKQIVTFDGINIAIRPAKKILLKGAVNPVIFELRDGSGSPMSGDSLELVVKGAYQGFAQGNKDSIIVVTDTRGQYATNVTAQGGGQVILAARALGAKSVDTVTFTTNNLVVTSVHQAIQGDGIDFTTLTARLSDSAGGAMPGYELRWTTTFGSFTTQPFSRTGTDGGANIVLRSAAGSGLASINVEAYRLDGATRTLVASGNHTIRVTALKVKRLSLKVTPDNIPVKVGEARLIAQAFDSTDNVMTGVLVGFRLIKGAGGGDEIITPPVSYTQSGFAQATLRAGGVISFYQSVKLAAVALDINGTDTLVIASSDTVGMTISGPPHKVSVGANINKGKNPEDGTFGLPTAAVVTDVNGNLVADGTPVNFGLHPVMAWRKILRFLPSTVSGYWVPDTVYMDDLPWTDYNNNGKLDPDEPASAFHPGRPARGEDKDGNGLILEGPDSYDDLNDNGVWDSANAEPLHTWTWSDSTGYFRTYSHYYDYNGNGVRDTVEPFYRNRTGAAIATLAGGPCRCTGQRAPNGDLYEETYFGSPRNRPYPGYSSVGIEKQVGTGAGKATTQITYVQSDATFITVRITAEANGIRNSVDVWLPIVLSEE